MSVPQKRRKTITGYMTFSHRVWLTPPEMALAKGNPSVRAHWGDAICKVFTPSEWRNDSHMVLHDSTIHGVGIGVLLMPVHQEGRQARQPHLCSLRRITRSICTQKDLSVVQSLNCQTLTTS